MKFDILSVSQIIDYLVFGQGECACTIFPVAHPQITTEAGVAGSLVCVVPRDHRLAVQTLADGGGSAGRALDRV